MKLIDAETNGNVVRFYFGEDDLTDYGGDDWDDRPLLNCGMVYGDYVSGYADVAFPMDAMILDPENDWHYGGNTPYCKDDFVVRVAPCLVIVGAEIVKNDYNPTYSKYIGLDSDKFGLAVYYNDDMNELLKRCSELGGHCFGFRDGFPER